MNKEYIVKRLVDGATQKFADVHSTHNLEAAVLWLRTLLEVKSKQIELDPNVKTGSIQIEESLMHNCFWMELSWKAPDDDLPGWAEVRHVDLYIVPLAG